MLPAVVTRTYTATDWAGNTATCIQLITLEDGTPPEFLELPEHPEYVCNTEPFSLSIDWIDNCSEGGTITIMPEIIPADPSDPYSCEDLWVYTFTATDCNGNSTTVKETITSYTESIGYCETAFAKLENDLDGNETGARCFDKDGFNRWGWVNRIPVGTNKVLDVYAGAGQCDLAKGTNVGTAEISFSGNVMDIYFDLIDDHVVTEAHIYAGVDMYPVFKNGKHKNEETVAPGQYTVVWDNGEPATEINASVTNIPEGTEYIYFIFHSEVCLATCYCPETNWTGIELEPVSMLQVKGKDNNKNKSGFMVDMQMDGNVPGLTVYPNPFDD